MSRDRWALVVAGDAHHLIAVSSILDDLGICYKRNTTGSGVIAKAEAMTPTPDFILLDLALPQGDAFEIAHSLKAHAALARVPVIAMADCPDRSVMERARAAGFDGLLGKPLPRRHFATIVDRILSGEHVWLLPA